MLIVLGKSNLYGGVVIRAILKKIKCSVSYFKFNKDFDGFTLNNIKILEFFLFIIREILDERFHLGFSFEEQLISGLKQALEDLKDCLESRLPYILKSFLENILILL